MKYIEHRLKIIEHELNSRLKTLEDLKEDGMSQEELIGFYKTELDIEIHLIDYIMTAYHIKDNKIKHYTDKIKGLIK